MIKIGFIGSGNMATAMITGIVNFDKKLGKNIYISDVDEDKLNSIKNDLSVNISTDNKIVAENADIIILSVKPELYPLVISEIKEVTNKEKIIATITPGFSISNINSLFTKDVKVVRAMPNTPSLVNEGMTALSFSDNMNYIDIKNTRTVFEYFGKIAEIEEDDFDAFTAVCGSAPAFVYLFIDALAQGGKLNGLSEEIIYKIVSQMVLGSASMIMKTGEQPTTLIDRVTTKGGATIEGVKSLKNDDFTRIVIEAVNKTIKKSNDMKKH